jgi:hypothetical protein
VSASASGSGRYPWASSSAGLACACVAGSVWQWWWCSQWAARQQSHRTARRSTTWILLGLQAEYESDSYRIGHGIGPQLDSRNRGKKTVGTSRSMSCTAVRLYVATGTSMHDGPAEAGAIDM